MSNTCLQSISKQRRKKYGANAPQLHPILVGIVVIVGARVVEWGGGDPCGRPCVCQLSTRWARAIMKKLELEQLRRHEQD
jgi:hypothetical protein